MNARPVPARTGSRWPSLTREGAGRARSATLHVALLIALSLLPRGIAMRSSLWVDELHTSWAVSGTWAEVPERARLGNQSPLYFQLQWLALRVLPPQGEMLRVLPLAAGLLLVVGLYALVRGSTGSSSLAFLVGAWAALDKNFVFYSTEARPYAVVQLVALLQLVLFLFRLRSPTRGVRVTFLALTALLLYLHYTTVLIIAAEFACLGLATVSGRAASRRAALRSWAVDAGLLVLLILPALPHAAEVFHRRGDWQSFVRPQPIASIVTMLHAARYVAPAALAWLIARATQNDNLLSLTTRHPGAALPAGTLCAVWFGTVGTAWLATEWHVAPLLHNRYLISVAVVPLLLAAELLARLRRGVALAVGAGVLLLVLHMDGYIASRGLGASTMRFEDWRGLVAELDRRADLETPILMRTGLLEADRLAGPRAKLLRKYASFPLLGAYRLSHPPPIVEAIANLPPFDLSADARQALHRHQAVWVIYRGSPRHRAEYIDRLRSELSDAAGVPLAVEQQRYYGTLLLVRFSAGGENGLSRSEK